MTGNSYWYEATKWKRLADGATTQRVKATLLKRMRDCERAALALEAEELRPILE
jgi:hypothetical protein